MKEKKIKKVIPTQNYQRNSKKSFKNSSSQRKYQNTKSLKKYQQDTKSSKLKKKVFRQNQDQPISVNQLIGKENSFRSSKRAKSTGIFNKRGSQSQKFGKSFKMGKKLHEIQKFKVSEANSGNKIVRPSGYYSDKFDQENNENHFSNFLFC